MAVGIEKIDEVLRDFSPLHYQCEWDNTGWNIRQKSSVSGIYVCLDVTEDIIADAAEKGCEVILSHHPLIFRAIKSVDGDGYVGSMAMDIIKRGMSLFCAHTAVDSAPWGINGYIADELGFENRCFLESTYEDEAGLGYVGDVESQPAEIFIDRLKRVLKTDSVRVCGDMKRTIKRAAVCGGGAGDLMLRAKERGAELYITGEVKHNQYIENTDMLVVEAGHYDTEKCFLEVAVRYLQKRFDELQYNVTVFYRGDTERPYVNY